MVVASDFEKTKAFMAKKLVEFTKLYVYRQANSTRRDPSCVQRTKYKLACTAFLE